jgi:hypothetical protein
VREVRAEQRADHAEVGHDSDAEARVARAERAQARPRAPCELVAGLAAAGAGAAGPGLEARERPRIARRDLRAGEPGPAPEVELSQAAEGDRLDTEGARERGRGLERACEVAGRDEPEAFAGELGGQRLGLRPPARGERGVAVTLPAPGLVPTGLGVADERDPARRPSAQPLLPSSRRLRAVSQAPSRRRRPGASRFA